MEQKIRIQKLTEVFYAIYHGKYGLQYIRENQEYLDETQPEDIVKMVDQLVRNNLPLPGLKSGISKFLAVVYKPLLSCQIPVPPEGGLLDCLIRNNNEIDNLLKAIRPFVKLVNEDPFNPVVREELSRYYGELEKSDRHYTIKENVLFPLIEKKKKEWRCLKVMWSMHDDIRKNLREIVELLKEESFDLARFNRLTGDVYFDMYAIRFREERILYPVIQETISSDVLNDLIEDCMEIGFPWYTPEIVREPAEARKNIPDGMVDLRTGILTPEQIILVFNHLPVDITFVDENDQVKYYSAAPDRLFTRTHAVLGRDVRNCHPPESVHMVEDIIAAFRKGERDSATFWINMKGEMVLIQYFACRDKKGKYKGVVEVSQVITAFQSLTGEKRLLDWKR